MVNHAKPSIELYLITCKVCEKEIGYAEYEDDGCAMCIDCYTHIAKVMKNSMMLNSTNNAQ